MKKLFVFSILIGLMSVTQAQSRAALGVKAGFNSTKIRLSHVPHGEAIENEAKSGYLVGAFARLRLIDDLSFQPEFYYAKKQSGLSGNGNQNGGNINSWDIPLLANLQLLDLKVARIHAVAGPVASFISSSDIENLKTTNWTFQTGLGVQIWKISADVRYEWGVKDITTADIGQKTDILSFSLAYSLFGM